MRSAPALLPPSVDKMDDCWRLVRAGLGATALCVLVFGTFFVFAEISGAVVAPAFVKVDLNRKPVQHQEGGIVSQVLVRDGSRVHAGQTLVILKDVRVEATNDLLRTQLEAEQARVARLNAELRFDASLAFPRHLRQGASHTRMAQLLEREQALFIARRTSLDSQIELLRTQRNETTSEIGAWSEQLKASDSVVRLQKEELAANEALVYQGFVSKTRLMGLQRTLAEYDSRRGENLAELSKARQRLAELELRMISLRNNYMQQAADELKEATSRVFDLQERLRPSEDAAARQEVKAPIGGEVVNLRVSGPGAVVGPREPLLELVPVDPQLIVEARVRPEDIASVHEGSSADVRLTAFKLRTTPIVTGKVIYVSADRLQDTLQSPPHYLVQIRVDPESLTAAGGLKLLAGMPAEVFILTGARTPLQYVLDPVTSYLRRSLREP